MSKKITYSSTIQVEGGPKIAESINILVEAYGVIEVAVPAATKNASGVVTSGVATVDVQPGEDVQFMLMRLEKGNYDDDLTYQVNQQGEKIALDGPQIFIGDGAVSLLGLATGDSTVPAPKSLEFTNGTSTAAAVQILVGRKATKSTKST